MGENLKKVEKVITLKVYYGTKMSFGEKGEIQNTIQRIKTIYDTNEWRAVISTLRLAGYAKVDVESVKYVKEGYPLVEDYSEIKEEVEKAFKGEKEIELTPEQQKIADLEAKLEKLLGNSADISFKEEIKEQIDVANDALSDAKNDAVKEQDKEAKTEAMKEYYEKVGKRALGVWDIETIKQKQAEHLAK